MCFVSYDAVRQLWEAVEVGVGVCVRFVSYDAVRQLWEAVEVGVGVCVRFVCALYRTMRGGNWGRWQVSSGGLLDMIWW
jgi:hypothetical protein